MPKVVIHSLGAEVKAIVIVNGVKKEFACDKAIDISDEYIEALKNSRFDVTEHDSAEGSAETGEDEQSSPVQPPADPAGDDGEKAPSEPGTAAPAAVDGDQDSKEPAKSEEPKAAAQPKPTKAKATKAAKAKA